MSRPPRPVIVVETRLWYPSVEECAKSLGGSRTGLAHHLRGARDNYKGYKIVYAEDASFSATIYKPPEEDANGV